MTRLLQWLRTLGEGGYFGGGLPVHDHTGSSQGGLLTAGSVAGIVGTGALRTATGSAAIGPADADIIMNDYSFSPSITDTGQWQVRNAIGAGADPGNTIGRLRVASVGGTALTARWRYVTASDDPTIWVVYDNVTHALLAVWSSDDPTDGPGVIVDKVKTPTASDPMMLKAADLAGLNLPKAATDAADAKIAAERMNHAHRLYRAIQAHTGDDAPARWILDRCAVQGGKLKMK